MDWLHRICNKYLAPVHKMWENKVPIRYIRSFMATLNGTRCCGVIEIDGISKHPLPQDVLRDLSWNFSGLQNGASLGRFIPRAPFITFTGVVEKTLGDDHGHSRSSRVDNYGEAFATYLEANNLGKVIRSTPRKSWSQNVIAIWIWEVDYDTLLPHLQKLMSYGSK